MFEIWTQNWLDECKEKILKIISPVYTAKLRALRTEKTVGLKRN